MVPPPPPPRVLQRQHQLYLHQPPQQQPHSQHATPVRQVPRRVSCLFTFFAKNALTLYNLASCPQHAKSKDHHSQ